MKRLPLITALLTAACTLAAGTLHAADAADAQLGRLFHSVQKRSILDELRARNARIAPEQEVETLRLDGIVRRSDGRSTVWVNGASYHEHAPLAGYGERSATVFAGGGRAIEIKVGETVRLRPGPAEYNR